MACPADPSAQEMVAETPDDLAAFLTFEPPAISEPFAMALQFCGNGAAEIERPRVDAIMPAHQHGMNYEPEVAATGEGRFAVSGMLFHMPGTWRVRVSTATDAGPRHFELDVAP